MTVLNSNGNVGIATTNPAHKLHVADLASGGGVLIGQYNERFGWTGSSSSIPYMGLRFAGYRDVVSNFTGAMVAGERINLCCSGLSQGMELGFWVQPSTATVSGDGNLVQRAVVFGGGMAALDYWYLSDRRLKYAEKPIEYGLQDVMNLRPLIYTQKVPKGMRESHGFVDGETVESFGFIAQDIQKIIPELVSTPEESDKYLTVSYGKLTPILVKAIQDQQKIIEGQQSVIDELIGRIEALEEKR